MPYNIFSILILNSFLEAPEEFRKFFDYISTGQVESLSDILNASTLLYGYKDIIGLDDTSIENGIVKGIDCLTDRLHQDIILAEEHKIQMFAGNIKDEAKGCLDYIRHKIDSIKQEQLNEYVQTLNGNFANNMELFANEFIPKPIAPNIRAISSPYSS